MEYYSNFSRLCGKHHTTIAAKAPFTHMRKVHSCPEKNPLHRPKVIWLFSYLVIFLFCKLNLIILYIILDYIYYIIYNIYNLKEQNPLTFPNSENEK